MRYKVVIENSSVKVWSGTREECYAYVEGAHANSVNPYLVIVSDGCCCGPDRAEVVIPADEKFKKRTGCSACNLWDSPPKLKG
jgi:hypothetical protein